MSAAIQQVIRVLDQMDGRLYTEGYLLSDKERKDIGIAIAALQDIQQVNRRLFAAAKALFDYKPEGFLAFYYSNEELELWEKLGRALVDAQDNNHE